MSKEVQQQLEQIKDLWDQLAVVPDDLSGWGFPGLTKQGVSDSIGGLAELAHQIEESDLGDLAEGSIQRIALLQQINQLRIYVAQHIPSNPAPHIPGFLTNYELTRLSLLSFVRESDTKRNRVLPGLSIRLSEMISRLDYAETIHKKVIEQAAEIEAAERNARKDASSIEALASEVVDKHTQVTSNAESTQNLRESVDENVATINNLVQSFTKLKGELENAKKVQQDIFGEFEASREKVAAILADTNRSGMASAFITRKAELEIERALWRNVFAFSILLLTLIGIFYLAPAVEDKNFEGILFRLPLTAPAVWVAWFAAKQYGYATRLREDYAYKVATSMAFEGYKREIGETDVAMKLQLLETAVTNFGDNPLRIFNGHENHASPLHEIVEKIFKDEKVLDSLKTAMQKYFSAFSKPL